MKVPINWLKDYVEVQDEKKLMRALTSIGHMQDGPPKEINGTNVYDLEVRQNRSDCLSILGIAREVAAIFKKKLKDPTHALHENSKFQIPNSKQTTKVKIENSDLCYRFNTVTIEDLKVGESPKFIKDRLTAYSIKSINNLVDITNFVMVELGQPLHAFDKNLIADDTLIIRPAKKGESLVILGDKEITLSTEDLVIADSKKVVALAGVIGGDESSTSGKTTSVILEAATYNQASIRKTSLRHQLRTEASTRLEKFLHPALTEIALQRAAGLILEVCGGKVIAHADSYPKKFEERKISLNIDNLRKLSGVEIDEKTVYEILKRLGITETAPYFRTDLQEEADLIEEVLRIFGYENIPPRLPSQAAPQDIDSSQYLTGEQIRDLLISAGYDEQITEPLTKEDHPKLKPIILQNSLNADKTMLRTTLKNALFGALRNQQKFRKKEIKLFEIGKIYSAPTNEEEFLGIVTSAIDYFELKGLFELLLKNFETELTTNELKIEILDPIEKTYFFEIPLGKIKKIKVTKPLSEPPHLILQDISLSLSKDEKIGKVIEDIKNSSKLLTKVTLGEDPIVKDGVKNIFLNLEFSSSNKNLTKEDIEPVRQRILSILHDKYHAKIRQIY